MRTLLIIVVTGLLAVTLFVGAVAFWFEREVVASESFINSTAAALDEESSRDAMSQMIVDQLVNEYPLLLLLRSHLVALFTELLGTEALRAAIRLVAADVHERIMTGNRDAIVIDLHSERDAILSPLGAVAPLIESLLLDDVWLSSVEVVEGGALPDLSLYADLGGPSWKIALGATVLLVGSLLWLVPRRATATVLMGTAFLLAGVATGVLVPSGRWFAIAASEGGGSGLLVASVYDQFVGLLFSVAAVLVTLGAVLTAFGIVALAAATSPRTHSPKGG